MAGKPDAALTRALYMQPLWQGDSHNTSVYTKDKPRCMVFRDVNPNPSGRSSAPPAKAAV